MLILGSGRVFVPILDTARVGPRTGELSCPRPGVLCHRFDDSPHPRCLHLYWICPVSGFTDGHRSL